jgi:hypothetical protein
MNIVNLLGLVVVGGWFALSPGSVGAQGFSLGWSTIDGGGGTSRGGAYELAGTVGQPDPGRLSGAAYALEGGFWSVPSHFSVLAPTLAIQHGPNGVVISWSAIFDGFELQETSTLGTVWVNGPAPVVTDGINRVTIPVAAGHRFYRLRKATP